MHRIRSNIFLAAACTALVMLIGVFSASAYSAAGFSAGDEDEILSSQDWEALLNASSEESRPASSQTAGVLDSPLSGGISGDTFFIWGCVAVGLGILGIAFVVTSQVLHKKGKAAPAAASAAVQREQSGQNAPKQNTPEQETFKPAAPHTGTARQSVPKRVGSFQERIAGEKPQEPPKPARPEKKAPQTRVEDVDWDAFFQAHKDSSDQ